MEQIVQSIMEKIPLPVPMGKRLIVTIDGRCASGKTTLAQKLHERFGCAVCHMDNYFLRPEQRTEARLRQAGGNVDHERFAEEILYPLRRGEQQITYRPFDCHMQKLLSPITTKVSELVVVEGSYSCHPSLWQYYDFHIFLTVDLERQIYRIKERNSDSVSMFVNRWVPMEEQFFEATSIQRYCELCFET